MGTRIAALLICAAMGFASAASAQTAPAAGAAPDAAAASAAPAAPAVDPAAEAAAKAAAEAAAKAAEEARIAELNKPFRDSVLFTPAEVTAVREAAAGRRTNEKFLDADKEELIPVDRKIKLSGIYYKNDSTWIVWMNGYKLHPRYLLPEIHKIQVKQDEVYLEWYDIGLNNIIKLKMRPHQIYDIVTGILYNDTVGGMAPDTGAK